MMNGGDSLLERCRRGGSRLAWPATFALLLVLPGLSQAGPSSLAEGDLAELVRWALRTNDEFLDNLLVQFRYHRMLPEEPDPPFAGSTRRQGLYCRVGDRQVVEQVKWSHRVISDNSSERVIDFYDGQRSSSWTSWNNSGAIGSRPTHRIMTGGLARAPFSYKGGALGWLTASSRMSNVRRWDTEDEETRIEFDLTEHAGYMPTEGRVHIVLSETFDYFPRLIQVYAEGKLLEEVRVTEFMPVAGEGHFQWFPKKAELWDFITHADSSEPRPAGQLEILSVRIGQLRPEDLPALVYPTGALVLDRDLRERLPFLGSDWHVRMDQLDPAEIPSYFPILGLGHALAEAQAWVDDHD